MYRCILCQIAQQSVYAPKAYEDEDVYAFVDWNPWAPVHIVAYPKRHIGTADAASPAFRSARERLLAAIPKIAAAAHLSPGYEVHDETAEEDRAQNEFHLHFHITGETAGRKSGGNAP